MTRNLMKRKPINRNPIDINSDITIDEIKESLKDCVSHLNKLLDRLNEEERQLRDNANITPITGTTVTAVIDNETKH